MEAAQQVSVVTGGSGGLGLAIARYLAKRGDRIVLWDLDRHVAEKAAEFEGGLGLIVDVTDQASVARGFEETIERASGIANLINSAGITGPNFSVAEYSLDDWRRVMSINLDGTFLCCRAVVPHMTEAGYGRIVNIASISGKEGNAYGGAYSASKAGVIALTKSLGKELALTDVRVNCIAPAMIETELLQQMTEQYIAAMKGKIPMGRLGRPEEAAALVGWLASPACSFSTGAVFDLSGGRATY
ncbi:SDR family NAD(P)-dependent oxidoreductase [Roseomonas gilardii]|uniref:3-oxoacyl-ACP reductase n=1 Tax=Roseomonas gilardii TaxID=257708 RepID=A0A1L7AMM2_9PROT|nr:SDR family NAD(P)-dependent oxidoreductase [Roseomonas gilardii]APT60016.1 3-oxoacyl-ACP reductase [Roseomonas gilardii]MDT8333341.1 SDR family NAD(P)-dependent oxidoreductase [Roseomonas gilardii]PZR08706.1 MAG: SDR family NAD(P)-dependent oxidoreductase [Azospirillum brasilense]